MDTDADDVELTLDLEPEPESDPATPNTAGDPAAEAFARLEGELALIGRCSTLRPNAQTSSFPTTVRH